MFRRPDGIVDFDKSVCIGCKACIAACPYDAIFINPDDHSAEKCNFCAHRIDVGLQPACVVVCPTQAIIVGDVSSLNDLRPHLFVAHRAREVEDVAFGRDGHIFEHR
jgi:Fe-S-cluster-containing dehydrogenase component